MEAGKTNEKVQEPEAAPKSGLQTADATIALVLALVLLIALAWKTVPPDDGKIVALTVLFLAGMACMAWGLPLTTVPIISIGLLVVCAMTRRRK